MGDTVGEQTARLNVSDLRAMLGLPEAAMGDTADASTESLIASVIDADDMPTQKLLPSANASVITTTSAANSSSGGSSSGGSRHFRVRRQSMEQLDLIKVFVCLCFIILIAVFFLTL